MKQLSDGNAEGTILGQSPSDRISRYGNIPITQRLNPTQQNVQAYNIGALMAYQANDGAAANANTMTTNIANITVAGLLTTDFILGVSKPTAQAGMGICNFRAQAANTMELTYCNPTAANVATTANETLAVTALRGLNVINTNISLPALTANGSAEYIATIQGANATGTAYTNANGQVYQIVPVTQGAGYYTPPQVIFPGAPVTTRVQVGTAAGLPAANNTSNVEPPFQGACATAIVANGGVVGYQMTSMGSGYAPNTTFPITVAGGNNLTPGLAVAINKTSAANAGLGIGNVRVAGPYQIGITYFNDTAANLSPPANDTYQICAFNTFPVVNEAIQVVATLANLTAAAANTSNQTAVTATGILATDGFLSASPTALQSPLTFGGGYCAANTINFQYGGGVPGGTPANGVYTFNLYRSAMSPPVSVMPVLITPTAVANNTTAEQIFTLPANVTLFAANSCTFVNKPSFTSGIAIVGCRANSTTTIGITYHNNTSANITPPAETYLVINVAAPIVVLGANQTAGYSFIPARNSYNYFVDLVNEIQHTLTQLGDMRGY